MVKVIPKIINLFELFASGEEYSFSEIAQKSNLTRSNLSHLLHTLCEERILEKVSYGHYRRGIRLTKLCMSTNPWEELLSKVSSCADNLMLWMNELAVVGMRDRNMRLTLVKKLPQRINQELDNFNKSYVADWFSTANGRVLLAHAPNDVVLQVLRRWGVPERKVWPEAATLPKLEKELEVIRNQGFVKLQVDEFFCALGVPVRDASGEAVLSLATVSSNSTCTKSGEEIVHHMQSLASVLENELKISNLQVIDLKDKINEFSGD